MKGPAPSKALLSSFPWCSPGKEAVFFSCRLRLLTRSRHRQRTRSFDRSSYPFRLAAAAGSPERYAPNPLVAAVYYIRCGRPTYNEACRAKLPHGDHGDPQAAGPYPVDSSTLSVAVVLNPAAPGGCGLYSTFFQTTYAHVARCRTTPRCSRDCDCASANKSKKPVLKAAYVEQSFYIGENQLEALIHVKSKNDLIADVVHCCNRLLRTLCPHSSQEVILSTAC